MKKIPVRVALPVAMTLFLLLPGPGADASGSNSPATDRSAQAHRSLRDAQDLIQRDPVKGHATAEEALEHAEVSGDPKVERLALRAMADADMQMGSYAEALRTAMRALDLSTELGDPLLMAADLRTVSEAYLSNGMPDRAISEARNALALVLPTQKAPVIATAHRSLLSLLMRAGHYDEVLRAADGAIHRAQEQGDRIEEARLRLLVGESLIAQRNFHDALPYVTGAGRELRSTGERLEKIAYHVAMCEIHMGIGLLKEADEHLAIVNSLTEEGDCWPIREQRLELRYQLTRASGDWKEAVLLLEDLGSKRDSVRVSQVAAQEARLRMTYQLDRKEQDNEDLRQENARRAELLSGEKLSNRWLIGGLLVMVGLALALVFTSRYAWRMLLRMRLKNEVIRRQNEEIHGKNLELQRQNMRLAETLLSEEEKEMMIKEIHHRVKNNLQVVDSLLHIQGVGSDDPMVHRILKEAQGRIRSMALVHERIYRSGGQGSGNLQDHLSNLVRNILVAHGCHDRISVQVEAPVVSFSTETLMPLTLVVNELFTNSVKYAFPGTDSGRISIVVRPAGVGYELLFSDNGVGLDERRSGGSAPSFGLELVQMLAEQLNGEVRFLKGEGTTVSLTFVPEPAALRVAS
jgi:two-component sensor histidine kinase/tetratricopeptide (TPR) repeat protein